MVSGLGAAPEKVNNLLPRCLPLATFIKGEDHPAFLL
jgi:hypothetical protein